MTRPERAAELVRRLPVLYPDARCELVFSNPLELLAATILSAQCTDKRVNIVTAALFRRCRTAFDYAEITSDELEGIIRSTNFYRGKARNLRAMGAEIVARHGGEVPRDMELLRALPGVGRKTANVVLGNAFGIDAGVVVDTHVGRLSHRLGLTKHIDPEKIERDLVRIIARALDDLAPLAHRPRPGALRGDQSRLLGLRDTRTLPDGFSPRSQGKEEAFDRGGEQGRDAPESPVVKFRLPPSAFRLYFPSMTTGTLAGKTGLVFGVANKRSIAWGIAQAWAAAGAKLIFSYQGERLKSNVEELVEDLGPDTPFYPCDVSQDDSIAGFFKNVRTHTEKVDLLLHSVAFAPKEALEADFLGTSREAFRIAHDISAYSLVALAREAAPLMVGGGSIMAMTYHGSTKVVPRYNVMGVAKASLEAAARYLAFDLGKQKVRVNCISAGPMNTLAARGISGLKQMIDHYEQRAPLGRTCTMEELGAMGVFLASDGSASITGQVLYVDGGYEIIGM